MIVGGEGDLLANPFILLRPANLRRESTGLYLRRDIAPRPGLAVSLGRRFISVVIAMEGAGHVFHLISRRSLSIDTPIWNIRIVPGEGRAQLARDEVGIHVLRVCVVPRGYVSSEVLLYVGSRTTRPHGGTEWDAPWCSPTYRRSCCQSKIGLSIFSQQASLTVGAGSLDAAS